MILQVNIKHNRLQQQAGRIYYNHGVIKSFPTIQNLDSFSPTMWKCRRVLIADFRYAWLASCDDGFCIYINTKHFKIEVNYFSDAAEINRIVI